MVTDFPFFIIRMLDSLVYWANEAAYRWKLRGMCMWSLGQEDLRTLGVATKTNRVIKGTSAKVGVLFISTKGGILNERNMELDPSCGDNSNRWILRMVFRRSRRIFYMRY